MKSLTFNLEHCYGITSLSDTFQFEFVKKGVEQHKTILIYSPNGTMKTSFSKTMKDFTKGIDPIDKIFSDRKSKRIITKSDGTHLKPEEVFIIESYNEDFSSDKLTKLLVSKDLKKEYDEIHATIEKNKIGLLKTLESLSGIKINKGLEAEFASSFGKKINDFLGALEDIEANNFIDKYTEQDSVIPVLKYSSIVNSKVKVFLEKKEVKELLKEYVEKYNELMDKSHIFKKGVFNHNNALAVGKTLQENGFFDANYMINIGDESINNIEELNALIEKAKTDILADKDLLKKFEKIDKLITQNKDLKEFRIILENNPEIIAELENFNKLKKKIWISYLKTYRNDFESMMDLYNKSKVKLKDIVEKAKEEKTDWNNVVDIFNNRFNVPFTVQIDNQEDVLLKESAPTLEFKYNCNESEVVVEKKLLLDVLSTWEKRALYLLNIIFEIEALKKENKDVLVIIDDIADSFDYKNKYAIIEYLKDIKQSRIFKTIILTHNFDFYRTVAGRLEATCLMTSRSDNGIKLKPGKYVNDIFNRWKNSVDSNNRILIASIPFIRNISQYIQGNKSENYKTLTGLLHIKDRTREIKVNELEEIYNDIWETPRNFDQKERRVLDIVFEEADLILNDNSDEINLENKIVLSIAIRLKAEEYMINRIGDEEFIQSISGDQTKVLVDKIKELYPEDIQIINKMDQIAIMTPENIHLNSFMYEPLLDISDNHLKVLYKDIKILNESILIDRAV